MNKVIAFITGIALCSAAYAGSMVNVEYIHAAIKQKWDIEIPYNPALKNPKVAANMKYLLSAVDRANRELNGKEATDYGNSEYATLAAADTIATNDAVARLIIDKTPKFFITTTPTTSGFSFRMSAAGTFIIDWGDGVIDMVVRDNNAEQVYSHTYESAGKYKIGLGGRATGYSTDEQVSAILFSYNQNIAGIDGSLGAVFGTIGKGDQNGEQPRFYQTFRGCVNMAGTIPEKLFSGIHGAPTAYMFCYTFHQCSRLSGTIPEKLFSGLSGAPAAEVFSVTFYGCSGLTGSIPENLFAGIKGPPAMGMFGSAFQNCSGLSGPIPEKLFAGISGSPAPYMFSSTFYNCYNLTEIPENLLAGIQGPAQEFMFYRTFANMTKVNGKSARTNGKFLYDIWPDATTEQTGECYLNDTGLTDYESIPANWK